MAQTENTRELALEVLLLVERGEGKLNSILHAQLEKHQYLSKQDRAFVGRLCEGVREYQIRLDYVLDTISSTPMSRCRPLIRCVLRMGAYQILFLDGVPDSAACNECVKLVGRHGFAKLSGFVNGVLRNLSRSKERLVYPNRDEEPESFLSVWYSLPRWLVEQWCSQYGMSVAQQMAQACVQPAPLVIRRNPRKASAAMLRQVLQQEGLDWSPIPVNDALKNAVPKDLLEAVQEVAGRLSGVDYLNRYESFLQGWFAVQDVSSMLPGALAYKAAQEQQMRAPLVLDLCAAPGGKTAHVASVLPSDARIVARDVSEAKVERLKDTLRRLQITNVEAQLQDAREFTAEFDKQADIVLLDAPCSGLGVLGRKKEIAYAMSPGQQEQLVALQRELLRVAARYVRPGGTLLYSTCTVHDAENKGNVAWFLEQCPDFWCQESISLLPGVMPTDGFFAARLERKKE